jgi:hypothetical protein
MLRIELAQHEDGATALQLDAASRQRLAGVLADWLTVYAGVRPASLERSDFDFVVEVRRVLLQPDEAAVRT